MKCIKMLGLLAVVIAALMAFAGTASATITSPIGTAYTGNIQMTSTSVEFRTGGDVKCGHSTLEGSVKSGATTIPITKLTFSECGTSTFAVLTTGQLTIASDGKITVSGTEYTKQVHRTVLGFPITTHCILAMENTTIGTLTEGVEPAVWHLESAAIPSPVTDSGCQESAQIVGNYTVTQPEGPITID